MTNDIKYFRYALNLLGLICQQFRYTAGSLPSLRARDAHEWLLSFRRHSNAKLSRTTGPPYGFMRVINVWELLN